MVLMTFQTIDLNMLTSQELDFRLITTSKITLVKFRYPGEGPMIPSLCHQARRLNRQLKELSLIAQSKQQR